MRAVYVCLLVVLLHGCISQSPTNYYTLSADVEEGTTNTLPKGVSLGVGPISLPSMLDRNGIVSHEDDGPQINVASLELWAGELDVLLARTIAERMAQHLNIADVWAMPWDARLRPQYQLRLFVDKFSGELGGPVVVKIKWVLLADYGKRPIGTHMFQKTQNAEATDYARYVQTLNQLLADFAAEAAEISASIINESEVPPLNAKQPDG
ncbi:MAG: PqiC family protein [Pseudomonadales bacterium]